MLFALLFAATVDHVVLVPPIELVAPHGYHIESSIGPDFRVIRLVPDGTPTTEEAGVGIYVGYAPNTFLGRMDKKPAISKKSATIAGKGVTWSCFKDDGAPMCETLVQGLIKDSGIVLHIWLMGHNDEQMAKYRALAASQIVRK